MLQINDFSQVFLLQVILPFITAFVVVYYAIPPLITIALEKKLQDTPDQRKLHEKITPTLGGVAIFAGIIISFTFWCDDTEFKFFKYTLISIIILFFSGIKDDIIGLSVSKRVVIHVVATILIIVFGDVKINDLNGIFGINEIGPYTSYLVTLVVITGITNAINLIDGLDGLAGGIGFIVSIVISIWFFVSGNYGMHAILGFAMCGALLAFLTFNFSPAKIFMGDTGALIVGFLISIMTVKFIDSNVFLERAYPTPDQPLSILKILSAPAVAIAILIVPIFDTLRVMILRIAKGKSPFNADRLHIHHLLVDVLGFSHSKASIYLYITNIIFIAGAFYLQKMGSLLLIILILSVATLLSVMLHFIAKNKLKSDSNIGLGE